MLKDISKNIFHTVFTHYFKAIIIFFLALFAFIKLYGPLPFSISTRTVDQPMPFSVTGEGTTYITPDIAIVDLGVSMDADTVIEAQSKANKIINDIKSGVKSQGVEDKNIKTSSYNIYPNYDYTLPKKNITSYSVNISMQITVESFTRLNDIIDSATKNGANQINNITFDVKDKQQAVDSASKLAIADAKTKAQKLAKESGLNLGRLLNVSVYETGGQMGYARYDAVGMGGGGGPAPTDIQPGQTQIVVQATLSYETL